MIASCCLITFNIVYGLTGLALIIVGALVETHAREYFNFVSDTYISTAVLLIILGVIIFGITLIGCCGAAKENRCLLCLFSVLMLIVVILEIVAGIVVYAHQDKMDNLVKTGLGNAFQKVKENETNAIKSWEEIQKKFHCCGLNGPSDFNATENALKSCCDKLSDDVTCHSEDAYKEGCYTEFLSFLKGHIGVIAGVAIGIAVVQVLCVIVACFLARKYKENFAIV